MPNYVQQRFRKGESVELLNPIENVKNLFEHGKLLDVVSKSTDRIVWKVKMDSGEVEYCEENFLQKFSSKVKTNETE